MLTHETTTSDGRCLIVRQAMGPAFVAGLLEYVGRREQDFQPATIYRDGTAHGTVDASRRSCLRLGDLGEFRAPFHAAVEEIARRQGPSLGVQTADLKAAEFEVCAYTDGGDFKKHADTTRSEAGVRVLSVVYYFSATPRPFTGGQLRIHPWPVPIPGASREAIDVEPECDTLVLFPSLLPHEVLPVHVGSDNWMSRRFNVTCWLWRVRPREITPPS